MAFDICSEIRKKSSLLYIRTPQLERDFDQILINQTLLLKNVLLERHTKIYLKLWIKPYLSTYSSGIGIDALIRGKPVVVSVILVLCMIRTKLDMH